MAAPLDVPENFVEFVTGKDGGTYQSLARHYCVSISTIQKWVLKANLKKRISHPPVPESWRETAPTLSKRELAELYDVSNWAVTRWMSETGVTPRPRCRSGSSGAALAERLARRDVNHEVYDPAADFLRLFYSSVHRCDIYVTTMETWGQLKGLPDKGRGLYFVQGVGVMTNEELLQLAKRYGYETLRV